MAYMSQEKKASLTPGIKAVLSKFGVKGSVGVRNHSVLIVRLKQGKLDLGADYAGECSMCGIEASYGTAFTGKSALFLAELRSAMNAGNHNRSDAQVDYFDVGWYTRVEIGQWDCPYITV